MMPANAPVANNAPAVVVPPSPGPTANQIAISPDRIIQRNNNTTVPIAITLTNATSGAALSGGTVTLTVISQQGSIVGSPVTANVGENGQVNTTYNLPANLRIGPYTLQAVYHNSGSALDGATGTALLYIAIGPINTPPASSSASSQSQFQFQAQLQSALSVLQTDFALFVDGVELAVDRLFHEPTDGVQGNIDAIMASGGSFGPFFEMAGEMMVNQAVQGHSM